MANDVFGCYLGGLKNIFIFFGDGAKLCGGVGCASVLTPSSPLSLTQSSLGRGMTSEPSRDLIMPQIFFFNPPKTKDIPARFIQTIVNDLDVGWKFRASCLYLLKGSVVIETLENVFHSR